ncbi:hypothetical protein G6F22_020415 [Rhizopus arrhizus]|nr:hypothetical protein G6F22_020415 [Rhizopus arrhizus]
MPQLDLVGDLARTQGPLGTAHAAHLQRISDVLAHRQMRVEPIVLKNHGHIAILGQGVGHIPPADPDFTCAGFLQPGHHAHRRCLAATRRAQEDHEFAVGNVQGLPRDAHHAAPALFHINQFYGSHVYPQRIAPATRPVTK